MNIVSNTDTAYPRQAAAPKGTAGPAINSKQPARPYQTGISLAVMGLLFFIFGFISWVNSILIPYFKIACELQNFQSYLVTFAFYISYFVMSVPGAYLLKKLGFKQGMFCGFCAMALGALLFIPAAYTRTYPVFLCGLFTIGLGLAILQTAANSYITVIGAKEHAAQRISIMGICNKGAGILAPIVFAAVILKAGDNELFKQLPLMGYAEKEIALQALLRRVMLPYGVMAVFLLLTGVLVRYAPLPEISPAGTIEEQSSTHTSILQFPHLMLGALAIFLHVGTQVVAIDTIIGYAGTMHIPLLEAKVFPSYTLTATIIGYLAGIVCIPRWLKQVTALKLCTLLGLLFSLLIICTSGSILLLGHQTDVSIWFVVLLGLPNALIWAGIWPLALDGLGRFTKIGASILIMGLCGNALVPLLYGYFADLKGEKAAYQILLPCYLYLVFYAFYGHRIKSWKFSRTQKQ